MAIIGNNDCESLVESSCPALIWFSHEISQLNEKNVTGFCNKKKDNLMSNELLYLYAFEHVIKF